MARIFVISDTHFNHTNMLGFDTSSRGARFKNTHEMDELIVSNWNSVVREDDIVYHLGDVYFGQSEYVSTVLERLKGRKRLILGNHDTGKDQMLHRFFQKIYVSRIFKEYKIMLTHIPVHESTLNVEKYARNVHGHIHDRVIEDPRYVNVCVEKTNYTPVELSTL